MREPAATFGPFTFDRMAGTLLREGKAVAIGTRGAALLGALVDADGAPATKEALMAAGWPGTIVEEGNLAVQIANLRKAMGLRSDGTEWIATVPRVGYRLLTARPPDAAAVGPVVPTLAVLPFENLGGDPEQEYFADGVVEDIITALSRFKNFAVIARNSSFVYKGRAVDVRELSKDLGVRYVLEGSVRRAGNKLRIAAQLVDCSSGANLWADQFDGEGTDVFDFQDRITASVAALVGPGITAAEIKRVQRERPNSVAAYDLYLRALSKDWTTAAPDSAEAYGHIDAALKLEPGNPTFLAHAVHILHIHWRAGLPPLTADDRLTASNYAERAVVGADDATVIAHCADAMIHPLIDAPLRGLELARRAAQMNPYNVFAVHIAGVANLLCGDLDDAVLLFQRALVLSPRDPLLSSFRGGIAHVHLIRGEYEDALLEADKAFAVLPRFLAASWILIAANAHLGRLEEARRRLAILLSLHPGETIASVRATQPDYDPTRIAAILEGLRIAGLPESQAP